MRTALFDYTLPQDRIALRPAEPRDSARLLVVRPGQGGSPAALEDRRVRDLPDLLRPGDALVLNDTRVIPAALQGVRLRDGARAGVSVTLIERLDAASWRALVRPAKRLKPGDRLRFGKEDGTACLLGGLDAEVKARSSGEAILAFDVAGPVLDECIDDIGAMPLPPYIAARRPPTPEDRAWYQTVFAAHAGAVAAPTAGLHFTQALFDALEARGISRYCVTLHVGAGTFLPVRAEDTVDHPMHAEEGIITAATAAALNEVRAKGGRLVAVGTTSLRLLESACSADGTLSPFCGSTRLFITPGYKFRAVDLLLTNFHLPRSTLLMLAAAFSGLDTVMAAYAHAVASDYRFYSYGDACMLRPQPMHRMPRL